MLAREPRTGGDGLSLCPRPTTSGLPWAHLQLSSTKRGEGVGATAVVEVCPP